MDRGELQCIGSQRVEHNPATSTFTFCNPQATVWYLVLVHSLLGTRPHTGGEWWVGEQAKLRMYLQPLPSTCIIA